MYNAYSTPKVAPEKLESHQPGVVLYLCENNTREVFVSEIVKICQIHGNLTKELVNPRNQCRFCRRIYEQKRTRKDSFNKVRREKIQEDKKKNPEKWKKLNSKAYKGTRQFLGDDEFNTRLLLRVHKISRQQYDFMSEQQAGKCKICEKPEKRKSRTPGKTARLALDHCHKTGKIRSLLCNKCNLMIGHAGDSIKLLQMAITYLRDHQSGS